MENTAKKTSLFTQLFRLRGELPPTLFLTIEVIGVLVLLGIWQLVASLGSTQTFEASGGTIRPYYNNKVSESTNKPYVLIYDKNPIEITKVVPLLKSLAANGSSVLLLSSEANQRTAQNLASEVPDLSFVAAKADGDKQVVYNKLSDFTGATILDDTYFANTDSTTEIGINLLGRAHEIYLSNDGLRIENRKELINNSLLPSPLEVLSSYGTLWKKDNLLGNAAYSIYLNLLGYIIAILIALPIGFLIGLFPLFRALFHRNIDALRFVPLTAVTGLFIAWFGIETNMKVAFLAFGIIVYLLPVIIQRIDEVEGVYTQTAYTLGASKWQQIKTVFIPAVISRVSDDIRVLVAISWTYIIVAELVNANSGGIGALAFKSARQSHIDKVFAILLLIILIGFVQDKLFSLLDRILFAHKYQTK